ncbi:MAG: hypothetical protein JXA91_02955 [Candidatus Thermoplasmatota archaeon]|nr:hypothetical protein [Candidatus Thermoplasmatota archaeon]
MRKLFIKKSMVYLILFILLCSSIGVNAIATKVNIPIYNNYSYGFDSYTDISVDEAWALLNNASNGIQIPIDVRTDPEWIPEHIDTPYPENPRHHNYFEWSNPDVLTEFLSKYSGKEIILYCLAGSRSESAANMLIDNNFEGTIYNMVGGIKEWKNKGYPIVSNRPPEIPEINGPNKGHPGQEYEFTLTTVDPDYDNILYCINWSEGQQGVCIGPYESAEEILINHSWVSKGIYTITVSAKDEFGMESDSTTFKIEISATELKILDIRGGFGTVTTDIKNIGGNTTDGIATKINIEGGLFSKINLTHVCKGCADCGTTLEPGAIKTVSTKESGLIFGIGTVEITVSAWATNADKVELVTTGYVIGLFVIVNK